MFRLLFSIVFVACVFHALLESALAAPLSFKLKVSQLKQSMTCSDEGQRIVDLKVRSGEYHLMLSELLSSGVVGPDLVCEVLLERWIADLISRGVETISVELLPLGERLLKRTEKLVHRLKYEPFYEFCKAQGLCARHFFDLFSADPVLRECEPSYTWADFLRNLQPHLLYGRSEPIENVSIDFHPRQPLVAELKDALKKRTAGELFTSTMSLGMGSLVQLHQLLMRSPVKVFMALDAKLIVNENKLSILKKVFGLKSNLFPIPMTSGSRFSMIYHWKMIFDRASKHSVISSMNLSTPTSFPYVDFLYHFSDSKVTNELRSLHR